VPASTVHASNSFGAVTPGSTAAVPARSGNAGSPGTTGSGHSPPTKLTSVQTSSQVSGSASGVQGSMQTPPPPRLGQRGSSSSVVRQQQQSLLHSRPYHHPGGGSTYGGAGAAKLDCQDQQCVEEECDPEECGDENRPPRDDNYTCGIDRRPLLPVLLITSTVFGALCMLMLQFPLVRDLLKGAYGIRAVFLFIYAVTLGCMGYCAVCDPGQLQLEDRRPVSASNKEDHAMTEDPPLPKRAHKTWLYKLPIRRYDHYCRWLTNCIGLLNHREFVLMCIGLVTLGMLGSFLDFVLVLATARGGGEWLVNCFLLVHLAYSVALTTLAYPILRLHIGFVSRNELANEWKRNEFYVVRSSSGKTVAVNDLSDDEFNDRFDSFQYDGSRNTYDKGLSVNCWRFWCVPRWKRGQLGEF